MPYQWRRSIVFILLVLATFVGFFWLIEEKNDKNVVPQKLNNKNYQQLQRLAGGAVQEMNFVETVKLYQYDVSRPISVDTFECLKLKNANPPYTICVEPTGYFRVELKNNFVWEPVIQSFIKVFFENYSDAMFVDLGMNIGLHSLYATKVNRNVRVLGVDPYLPSLLPFHKSAHKNNVQDRFTVILGAISDRRGFAEVGGDDSAGFTIRKNKTWKTEFNVPFLTLSDLTPLVKSKNALLKMDMEGSECVAFGHAEKFFDTIDIPAIIMEFRHTKKQGSCCVENMLKFLAERKYVGFSFGYQYPNQAEPLDFSKWRDWNDAHDIYFQKIY